MPIIMPEIATPSTPIAGWGKFYYKSDGWYALDDAGVETGPFAVALPLPIPISDGGTGQDTAGEAFDALTVQGVDIPSATTTDIGAATGLNVNITGTVTITGLGTKTVGVVRFVKFTGALILTHNASSLILPGAANITTANGDTAIFVSLGASNWKCMYYFSTTNFWGGKAVPAGVVLGTTDTQTVINKRITKRVLLVAGTIGSTPTFNTDSYDVITVNAQASAFTNFSTNVTGTPAEGDELTLNITDNGTARAFTWGALWEASTIALPTTTVVSTRLSMRFAWNAVTGKWRLMWKA